MRWLTFIISFVLGVGVGAGTVFYLHPHGMADLLERSIVKLQSDELRTRQDDIGKLKQQVDANSSLATRYFNKCEGDRDTIEKLSAELSRLRGFCKEP